MTKNIVIALSVVFVLWVGAIFVVSTQLVSRNWAMFKAWHRYDRTARVKMALWLAVPILMAGLLWMRSIAIVNYIVVKGCCPIFSLVQMLIYLPAILVSLALILWWMCDLTFEDDGVADQAWRTLLYAGLAAGVLSMLISWRFSS